MEIAKKYDLTKAIVPFLDPHMIPNYLDFLQTVI